MSVSSLTNGCTLATDFVGPVPNTGIVYVIVGDRTKFDQINRPVTEHPPQPNGRQCLSKSIGTWVMSSDDGLVIFQHWLDAPVSKTVQGE